MNRIHAVLVLLAALLVAGAARSQPGELSGSVRERGTRRKLAGIEVSAGDASAITDSDGKFALPGFPPGPRKIVIAAPGYKRFEASETIPDGQRLEVAYLLEPLYSSPYQATITGERARREVSRTTISMAEIERVPGAQGDPLKVIEDLPGVARTSPIGGGMLVVRGSKPDDSRVYLDGEPIPNLYHFGALSSTVNPDLLSGIEFVPGNFGASYGDLTGGLVEVRTRSLREELHGYANLNLLESSVLLEGPLAPGLSFAVAARRSYMDAWLRGAVGDDARFTAAPRYYDAQLRLDFKPEDSAHQLSLFALTSGDRLGVLFERPISDDPNQSGTVDTALAFSQVRAKHAYRSGALTLDTIAMFENVDNRFRIGAENIDVKENALMLRSTAAIQATDELAIAFGFDGAARRYRVDARFPKSGYRLEGEPPSQRPDDAPAELNDARYDRLSTGAWAELRLRPLPGLTVTPGVRYDEYDYYTDRMRGAKTVTPRLTARWEATAQLALKGGVGLYSQGARDGDPLPVFGNPDIRPERALQVTAGAEVRPVQGLFVSVEGFWKKLDDLVVHTSAVDASGDALNLDNAGTGRTYGVEVLVRKELTERAFGWIAYTLSRSVRVDRPGRAARLFDYDQTHNLTAVAGYKLGGGWQVGGRLRLISGNPQTPVTGSTYLASTDSYLPVYGPVNSTRAPLFWQLDLRVDRVWTFDSWMLDAYLDVLNATNHRSIEGNAFSYDFSQSARVEGLPILPSLGLKASF